MKPIKTSVSITLDHTILEQVKSLAEQNDRSLSSYINLVLKAHLEQLSHQTSEYQLKYFELLVSEFRLLTIADPGKRMRFDVFQLSYFAEPILVLP